MFFVEFILIAAVSAVVYFSSKRNENNPANDTDSPLEIIEKRYARGEIDRAELERRRSLLKEGHGDLRKGETK